MAKKGDLNQWRELADLTKQTRDNLIRIRSLSDQIMPQKDWLWAGKAQYALDRFRSHAEDIMFKQLGEAGGARIDMFYGSTEGGHRAR